MKVSIQIDGIISYILISYTLLKMKTRTCQCDALITVHGELAVRLKCAIMIMYDGKELHSCVMKRTGHT